MKILTVVGARPQFVKASAVSRAITAATRPGRDLKEIIVHTGQHYDDNMSATFFRELGIPEPTYHLGVGGLPHGALTGRILERLETVLETVAPTLVLVYGDTDSTLAGALAAVKLHLPVAHVEAGLRSFNRGMPEEINRVVADHVSSLLFCPTNAAVTNLADEGIGSGVHLVGDVMYDVALRSRLQARSASCIRGTLGIAEQDYALVTVHRQENTDSPDRLAGIIGGLRLVACHLPVVLPLHPRTRGALNRLGWEDRLNGIRVVDPLPYLDMVALEADAAVIYTDSGGVQKEAFFYGIPCVTLRTETEWLETVEAGRNRLVDAEPESMIDALEWALSATQLTESGGERGIILADSSNPYGDGHAAEKIVQILCNTCLNAELTPHATDKDKAT